MEKLLSFYQDEKPIEIPIINVEHESGAVRSNDANNVDFWLISPIGLGRAAKCFSQYNHNLVLKADFINNYYDSIYNYLAGSRVKDFLAIATVDLFNVIHLDHYGKRHDNPPTNVVNNYTWLPPIAVQKLAETYNEGKIKYSAYNCEKGFPVHDLLNHSIRHVNLYQQGDTSEPQLPHASWGTIMAMQSEEMWPHLNEGFLRGANCTLTEAILKKINNKE